MKSTGVAYLLWCLCLVGFCGIHRFYAGKWITGLIWLFTFGLLYVGQIVDLFLIPGMIERANLNWAVFGSGRPAR
jgi:TM2 domain-containing membrane protein YozV